MYLVFILGKLKLAFYVLFLLTVSSSIYASSSNNVNTKTSNFSIGWYAPSNSVSHTTSLHQKKIDIWTLEHLNNINFTKELPEKYSPVYAKAQVLLARHHASPGGVDGQLNLNTIKAISAFQIMNGLQGNGVLNEQIWRKLNETKQPAFIEYKITASDISGPYLDKIPLDYLEQSKLQALSYTRVTEMLAERFQMDELFLQKINPYTKFNRIGETILVANKVENSPKEIKYLVAYKTIKQLYAFDKNNKIIASFPATIGSEDNPSPSGTHTIANIVKNPYYSYSPKNFVQGNNLKPLTLAPGPNNPVGNIWIGLSKPSFGIHGTPSPSLISKSASHGCIRLTNWDASALARTLIKGTQVRFID